ncbi:uncharacterized protein LOC131422916 [Diceros bicornis minor]|uniref:uncharacterized protein LOC131422916 n=1 Tax=Diceros bicornis minor TaxID=77932 RepID=UPI0026EF9812|nr:uncharacterized protein LOC131422916 [Diceros bicornis minor]
MQPNKIYKIYRGQLRPLPSRPSGSGSPLQFTRSFPPATTRSLSSPACSQVRNNRPRPLYPAGAAAAADALIRVRSAVRRAGLQRILPHFPGQPRGEQRARGAGRRGRLTWARAARACGRRQAAARGCGRVGGPPLTLYRSCSCNACGKFHHVCEDQPACAGAWPEWSGTKPALSLRYACTTERRSCRMPGSLAHSFRAGEVNRTLATIPRCFYNSASIDWGGNNQHHKKILASLKNSL